MAKAARKKSLFIACFIYIISVFGDKGTLFLHNKQVLFAFFAAFPCHFACFSQKFCNFAAIISVIFKATGHTAGHRESGKVVDNVWKTLWKSMGKDAAAAARQQNGGKSEGNTHCSHPFSTAWTKQKLSTAYFCTIGGNVDNYAITLTANAELCTPAVDDAREKVENDLYKKKGGKFSTYPRHIILFIFFFS